MLKVFQSFAGKWSFNRNIVHKSIVDTSQQFTFSSFDRNNNNNNNNNNTSIVTGTASFNQLEDEFSYQYQEEGILKQPDNTEFNVSQRYIYRFKDDIITVYFDEKPERLFHTLNFDNSSLAKGHHLCGKDTYDSIYQFVSPKEFKLIYSVLGPKKNYKITTTFIKKD
ncbi:hypothetical protein RB653_009037 [Dictyostelium firmibasis]|uniref:DUF6314 domain-containing protein n=1 Tax=Dictyostelium firmibasis TaxID=79012 RepID=A0AAN7U1A5_9MYCE